ncbi:hypothetical protein OVA24_12840 [Luteolibacter sp. SL250]|uniref:hypothetical protein n=1 Tax=Luteolibacter sp. SL250 TaxID=2995170 RepID=UPI00226F7D29|nr:hypothetical protein [Luteolibacter sp. SL250]WAC18123.1 hypothetical protein OVA24_12840 [Luteolibacter sp. SL250]
MKILPLVCVPISLSVSACGKRNAFVTTNGGSWEMHGTEKERIPKTGRYGGWLFTDSEPDWQATHLHFTDGSQRFDVPAMIIRNIAHPSELDFSVSGNTPSNFTISLSGGDAAGFHIVRLYYRNGTVRRAEADTAASFKPISIYP